MPKSNKYGKRYWLIPGQLEFKFTYKDNIQDIVMEVYSDRHLMAYMKKMAGQRWEELRHIVIEKLLTSANAQRGAINAKGCGKLNRYASAVTRNAWMDIVKDERRSVYGVDAEPETVDIEEQLSDMTARELMENLEKDVLKYIYSDFTNQRSPYHFNAMYFVASIKAGSNRALGRSIGIPEKAIREKKQEYLKIIRAKLK